MNIESITLVRRAVRPVQCFRDGWQLIKEDYWLFFGITIVGLLIASVFPILLQGPMWCGIDLCLLRRLRGRPVVFSDLFKGFDYFGQSVIATLLVIAVHFVLVMFIVAIYIVGLVAVGIMGAQQGQQGGQPDAAFFALFGGVMTFYIISVSLSQLIVMAPCLFMYSLIVERRMSGLDAFTMSIKAIFANFLGVVGLLFLYMLASLAGVLAFLIGGVFLAPIYYAAFVSAYRQVFPLESSEATEELAEDAERDEADRDTAPRLAGAPSTAIQAEWPRDAYPETGIASGPAPE